jgi:hypothetical protein
MGNIEKTDDNKHLWDRFCKLGEMMGDGLHHESDGAWIKKEYRQLAKTLMPDAFKVDPELRKAKNADLDAKMANLLSQKKCECGGALKQKRSGTLVCYCDACGARYVAKYKKTKK